MKDVRDDTATGQENMEEGAPLVSEVAGLRDLALLPRPSDESVWGSTSQHWGEAQRGSIMNNMAARP